MSEERPVNNDVISDTIIDTIPAGKHSFESDNVMEQLWRNPLNWYTNLKQFNNDDKKTLFPKLKKFFDEEIGKLSIINIYWIQYKVSNKLHSMPLKPEVWNKLMENFRLKNFILDMDNKPPEIFYQKGSM